MESSQLQQPPAPQEKPSPGKPLSDFLLQSYLSDVTLVSPFSSREIPAHKVVLAAGSRYFFDYFKQATKAQTCKVPQAVPTAFKPIDDPLLSILQFFYSNQDFACLESGLALERALCIYSHAFVLSAPVLIDRLEQYIVEKLLNVGNASSVLIEGIRFGSAKLKDAAEKLLVDSLDQALATPEARERLLSLPLDQFVGLCKRDDINVEKEMTVLELVKNYIVKRDALPVEEEAKKEESPVANPEKEAKEEPDKEEEVAKPGDEKKPEDKEAKKPDETAPKPPEEKKAEDAKKPEGEEKKEEKKEEGASPPAEKEKKDEDEAKAEPEIDLPYARPEMYKQIEEKLRLRRLKDEEKVGLLKCVRFSHLEHKQLLKLVADPVFALGKDFILQGLSIRLNQYEDGQEETKLDIELRPRNHYVAQAKSEANKEAKEEELAADTRGNKAPQEDDFERDTQPLRYGADKPIARSTEKPSYAKFVPSAPPRQDMMAKSVMAEELKSRKADLLNTSPKPPQKSFYRPAPGAKDNPLFPEAAQVVPPEEFAYSFDFDEGGLMHFLGSYGKTRGWMNPHIIGQVTVFASSIGYGALEDIVGRVATNCRTLNEPLSFFGIDLGADRAFLPSCYTLRNRNISSHSLLNWQFEGSVDKVSWDVLDRRVYLPSDPVGNAEVEPVRTMLKRKGATSTWAIEAEKLSCKTGYRYFRVVQIGKNSSGSDNLSLSGLEIYGRIIHGRFPQNNEN